MRLIKLAVFAIFGYAIYEFARGMLHEAEMAAESGNRHARGNGRQRAGGQSPGMNISGPGKGIEQATLERDGSTVRHKVGRGVVS